MTGNGEASSSGAGSRTSVVPTVLAALGRGARHVLTHPGLALSVLVLVLVLGWSFAPGWFTGQSPIEGSPAEQFRPPSPRHPFGTDQLGRDLYTRVVYGSWPSLRAAVTAIAIAFCVGSLLGLVAGFRGGWVDNAVMRVIEVMLSIPSMLLSLLVISALGFGALNVALAVAVVSVAGFARLMRAEVMRIRAADYVEAAIMSGARWWRILFRYVLPPSIGAVVSLAALDFGLAVLAVSSLSFLGYGPPPPMPEWGSLISEGRDYLTTAWWMTTLPGLTVVAVVLAANRVSRLLERERTHS